MEIRESKEELVQKIINKDKWWDMLSRFIDVLRINLFVVNTNGLMILPPEERKYGGRVLIDSSFGFDLLKPSINLIDSFHLYGKFLESINRYDLYSYAIPIMTNRECTIAYVVIGPIILNKRLSREDYLSMAYRYGVDGEILVDAINELRVISNVMLNSILDLLAEIIRDNVDLSLKEQQLDKIKVDTEAMPKGSAQAAKEIYSTVHLDEILVTLLDVALKITNTEAGSVMVMDEKRAELTIKVSKGIESEKIQNKHIKLGEGIAGIAAQEEVSFIIKGQEGDNRIRHLLNRPEIRHSLILPLHAKDRVFGILNLHTKKEENSIYENIDNLKYLSKLLSSHFR